MYKLFIFCTGLILALPLLANYSLTDSEVHGLDVDAGRVILPNRDQRQGPEYYVCNHKGQPYYCTKESGGQQMQSPNPQPKPHSGTWDPKHDFSKDRY